MHKIQFKFLKLFIIFSFILHAGITNAEALFPKTCEVTPDSIANIKLGSTLDQVKIIYPNAKLARAIDGDGVALVSLKQNNQDIAIFYAGESDASEKINFSKKIEVIETFSRVCKTKFGIRPKMALKKAAYLLGGIESIRMSEIEGRQYVKFKNSSGSFIYKINYCGDFANDSMRQTNKYLPDCTILSIAISK